MRNIDFGYWLEGFFEIAEAETLTAKQVKIIQEHLKLTQAREELTGLSLWLDGFLKGANKSLDLGLDKEQTSLIKDELKKRVINVMDKQGDFDLQKFQEILELRGLDLQKSVLASPKSIFIC